MLSHCLRTLRALSNNLTNGTVMIPQRTIMMSSLSNKEYRWLNYNETTFPPQEMTEQRRPAYVCHMNESVKYSPDKLWYPAVFVRGMSIDEALRQLDYVKTKGAYIVKETLLQARELAVKEHNVEFKTNLWVAESFSCKSVVIKGLRRHARARFGIVKYKYAHYFVRLEEGSPPETYYLPKPLDGPSLLEEWIKERRQLQITTTY